jgi:aerobic carbon-monoxide dehydrogenase medium subunit
LKPAAFNYAKPSSVDEAIGLLSKSDGDAQILAGGQSLMPTLNMRLSTPSLLVDINGIKGLSGITVNGDQIRVGALTRHVEVETSADIAKHVPLVAMAMPLIAHPAIRNRGTIGGSVAMADPAAELPACLCALDGEIEITGPAGIRDVAANIFFKSLYETDAGDNDIITAIKIPKLAKGYRSAFDELARRHGDYAMCGVAAHGKVVENIISDLRLVFFAVGGTPVIAQNAMNAMEGTSVSEDSLVAIQNALEDDLDTFADLHCSAKLRMHYAKVLTNRVLNSLVRS